MNSKKVSIAKEGFLSSKTCSNDAYSLASDLDEAEVSKEIEAMEICKIKVTPKKKIHFMKKSSAEISSTSKTVLNSTKITIPREEFLSSETNSYEALSSISDLDETEISKKIEAKKICKIEITPKEKIHSTKQSPAETSSTSKRVLNSTKVTIPRGDFLSSETDSCDAFSLTSDIDEVEVLKKKEEEEICKITPKDNIHTAKYFSAEPSSTTKVVLNSTEVTIPREDFLSSKTSSCDAPSSTSDPVEIKPLDFPLAAIPLALSHLSHNSACVKSSPTVDTKRSSSISYPTIVPKSVFQPSSQVSIESDFITITPVFKTAKSSSSPKTVYANKMNNSNREVATDSYSTANNPILNTTKCSNSFKATITEVGSDFPKSVIFKELLHSSRKTGSDSASNANSAALNAAVNSSSSKTAMSKEVFHSSSKFTGESTVFPDISLTVLTTSTESIPANNKLSSVTSNWDNLTMNIMSPKEISKYMLNIIHDKNVYSSLSSNTSVIGSNTTSDCNYYESKNSLRRYSKAPTTQMQHLSSNKSCFQPIMKTNAVTTSTVAVSQTKQATLVNSTHSICNATSINLHKINISPIVKHRKPDGKL
ncbi:uncharacterized protein LOC129980767 [Argiope bruennichi]|uniref:uncharacterized protein LOC129980767 n=1 Tax=Argiope bruennichi TaxID=94029 RepID=UPI002495726A|nr:uncharacterized protein LOC129980767 [Argiope bruennichi]